MEQLIIDGEEVEIHRNYYDNGQLANEWTQTRWDIHGYSKEFYENGQLRSHTEYKNGKPYRWKIQYYPDGQVKSRIAEENGLCCLWEYYENGAIKHKGTVNDDLKFTGMHHSYYENGQIQCQEPYDENGQLNGEMAEFYENGQPSLTGRYEQNVLHRTNQWLPDGTQVIRDGTGLIELKDHEGKLISRESYVNGLLHGYCEYYHAQGLQNSVHYESGALHGEMIYWYRNGRPKDILLYRNGELIDEKRHLPKYDHPAVKANMTVFLPEKSDQQHRLIPQEPPEIVNLETVMNNIEVKPDIFSSYDNEGVLTEVYRLSTNMDGSVNNYTRSMGSIIPVELLEKALQSIRFDMSTLADKDGEIWVRFDFNLAEGE